jgi:hypothetical protein
MTSHEIMRRFSTTIPNICSVRMANPMHKVKENFNKDIRGVTI